MATPQSDSSTTLNTGSGGDAIRDVQLATPAGTVKQQVVSVADPNLAANVGGVDSQGSSFVRDREAFELLRLMVTELKRIRLLLENISNTTVNDLEIEDDI